MIKTTRTCPTMQGEPLKMKWRTEIGVKAAAPAVLARQLRAMMVGDVILQLAARIP